MKRTAIAAAFISFAATSAFAADMAVKARPAPAPVYSWTGCYLDAGGGYGMWTQSHNAETFPGLVPAAPEITAAGRGYYGSVGGGCDFQFALSPFGNFVVGVLGGYDFMSLKGAFGTQLGGGGSGYEKETGSAWVGGRIGYLVTPNLLTYVSGGWANARYSSINFVGNAATLPSHTYGGYFVGGGAEMSLSPWLPTGFFLRTDYKVSTYRPADLQYSFAGVGLAFADHMNNYVQQVGTELIYRFNWH